MRKAIRKKKDLVSKSTVFHRFACIKNSLDSESLLAEKPFSIGFHFYNQFSSVTKVQIARQCVRYGRVIKLHLQTSFVIDFSSKMV